MKYNQLGLSGITVSELCFGILPMGPLQANISPVEGGAIIRQALEMGVNFIDTAEMYETYNYIRKGIEGYMGEVVIASKSTAEDYEGMEKAIQGALRELKRDVIDIFHLHAARVNTDVLEIREGALKCLIDYKQKGYIRATGIATHGVKITELASTIPELDVVFPLINKNGKGIRQGSTEEMLKAIEKCHQAGKGIYAMKALAGGNLLNELFDAISFVRNIPGIQSTAIGMIKKEELALNVKIFNDEIKSADELPKLGNSKEILITPFCTQCGNCIETCPNEALSMGEDRAIIDHNICILCGYCYPVCPEFAIRMI